MRYLRELWNRFWVELEIQNRRTTANHRTANRANLPRARKGW